MIWRNFKQNTLKLLRAQFELRCDSLESDKVQLLTASIRKGETIKKLREEMKSVTSSYQEFEGFTEVKVHSFLEGFWYSKIEAPAYYPNYIVDLTTSLFLISLLR